MSDALFDAHELQANFEMVHEEWLPLIGHIAVWRTRSCGHFPDIKALLLESDNAILNVREGLLDREHYLVLIEFKEPATHIRFVGFVSLFGCDPVYLVWPSHRVLIVGSYQTVYVIECDTLVVRAASPVYDTASVNQLCLVCDERKCIAVCDTSIVAFNGLGREVWHTAFSEPIKVVRITYSQVVCSAITLPDTDYLVQLHDGSWHPVAREQSE